MKYYVDGFTLGNNPSSKGGGYTIVDETKKLIKRETIFKNYFTNNDGEVLGLLDCLRLAENGDIIVTDSYTAMRWVLNGKSKARKDLNPLCLEGKNLLISKNLKILLEPRDTNFAGQFNEFGHVLY